MTLVGTALALLLAGPASPRAAAPNTAPAAFVQEATGAASLVPGAPLQHGSAERYNALNDNWPPGASPPMAAIAASFEQLTAVEAHLDDHRDWWELYFATAWLLLLPDAERPLPLDLEQVVEAAWAELDDGAWYEIADLLRGSRPERCTELIEALLARGTGLDARLHWMRGTIAIGAWRGDEARAALDAGREALWEDDHATRIDLLILEALIAIDLGLADVAAAPLDAIDDLLETHPDLAYNRFAHDQANDRWDLLTENWGSIVRRAEASDEPNRMALAIALMEQARLGGTSPDRARTLFRELMEDPEHRERAAVRLAEIETRAGRFEEARALLSALDRPDRAGTHQVDETLRLPTAWAVLALDEGADDPVLRERLEALSRSLDAAIEARSDLQPRLGGVSYTQFHGIRTAVSTQVELTLRLESAAEALEVLLKVRNLSTLARHLGGEATTVDDVQRALPAGGGALAYLPGPYRSHVFLIEPDRVECARLPALRTWSDARKEVQTLFSKPPKLEQTARRAALDGHLAELSGALLPDAVQARLATWSEVVVEGLEGYLPFEALPLGNGRSVGLSMPVSTVPSLSVGVALKRRDWTRPPASVDLRVIAAPPDLERSQIPWEPEHSQGLERWCPPGRFTCLTGEGAARGSLFTEATARTPWLLLVLHGTYAPEREQPAGLLLGAEGGQQDRVFAEHIGALSAPRMVFLGVCGAGRGPIRGGDAGMTDLSGAFFRAGADTVILSPVDLEFHSLMALTQAFQEELARGVSTARAMHLARVRVSEMPGWEHPYYHQLVHVVGLGAEPVYDTPLANLPGNSPELERHWPRLLLALVALAAIAGLWMRSRRAP